MRSADRLHKEFESHRHQGAVTRTATITGTGLIIGAGTLLVRAYKDQFGQLRFALREDRDRAVALHCIAFRQAPKPDFLHHVACAANHWPHDKALANLRLVFARLPKLASEDDAWRLHLAAALLDDEYHPGRLLSEIGFERIDFRKYDPDQPRVPAGQGRQSGEWGSTGSSFKVPKAPSSSATASSDQVTPQDAKAKQSENSMARDVAAVGTRVEDSFLGSGIDAEALAGLTEFASKFTAATAFFGAIFIPSPNSGTRSTGTLPGTSSVTYSVDHDTVPAPQLNPKMMSRSFVRMKFRTTPARQTAPMLSNMHNMSVKRSSIHSGNRRLSREWLSGFRTCYPAKLSNSMTAKIRTVSCKNLKAITRGD